MIKKGIMLIIFTVFLLFITQNIDTIKNKLSFDEEVLGYSEYIEYIAWENKMLIENPDYEDLKILIDISEKQLYLLNGNELINKYSIASGKLDTPSPIGTWKIISKAQWGGGFGTRWMGLNVPWGTFY